MKTTFSRELPLILLVLVPITYLAIIWTTLPALIPMQYDLDGNISRYGSKNELMLISILLPSVIYLIFLILPKFDPKGKISKMGNKYYHLKITMVLFMSALAVYFIYSVHKGGSSPPNGVFVLIGLLFAVLGNYFQSVPPNYFIGIRTPWTLENETVWRATHRLAGWIWLIGGIVIAAAGFFMQAEVFMTGFLVAIVIMALVPMVYSFFKFRELKKHSDNQ